MLAHLLQDLRYSLRGLLAKPMFLVVAVLTLGLGIGANTAIFSVMHSLLLRPLPYADGERLVEVFNRYPNMNLEYAGTSIPDYLDRRAQAPSVEDMALYASASFGLSGASGTPERLTALRATPSLFSTLGVQAALGQVFTEAHAVPGADQVAVLSFDLWRNRFNADPALIGSEIRLNGQNFTVLGVMPEYFSFPNRDMQLWVPFAFTEQQKSDQERGNEYSASIARIKPGTRIEGLIAEFDTIISRNADRIATVGGDDGANFAAFLRAGNFKAGARSVREQQVGEARPVLTLLQAAVGMVLLIACANLANLMLIRMHGRRKELTLRSALGASRGRIALQVLGEALLLALLGGVVGLLVAALCVELMPAIGLQPRSADYEIRLDTEVLLFGAAISVLAGLLATALPLLSLLRMDVGENLKEGGRSGAGGRRAAVSRQALVVVQMALATTLLIGAGLLLRSFHALSEESPGFTSTGLLTARVDLDAPRHAESAARQQFVEQSLARLRALPGVQHVAFTSNLPFSNSNSSGSYNIVGRDSGDGEASPHGMQRQIAGDYFEALQIPLLAGRYLNAGDSAESERVVVIDEILANKYFNGREAVGQQLRRGGNGTAAATVVGVVGAVKHQELAATVSKETLYWPVSQATPPFGSFVLRADVPAEQLIPQVRDALRAVDPEQPVYDIRGLDERIALSLNHQRAPMLLLGVFAGASMLLAAIGIYGVLAYSVSQRIGELGVRMAIGAGTRDILGMVLGQGARLTAIGLVLGLVGAVVFGQIASSELFGVSAADPLTYVVVSLFLSGVALLACYLPARRAARTDPMVALRHE
jgi:predicted permease